MITLKENQSYAITMRFIRNKLQYYLNAVEQEIDELDLKYPRQWGEAAIATSKQHLDDLMSCNEALQAGMITVKYATDYCATMKDDMNTILTKYARRLLAKQESLKQNPEKLEPLVLAVVEFKRFDPVVLMKENLSGREAKLEQLSSGVPSYSAISTVLRVEEVAPKNLLAMIQKNIAKKADVAKDEQREFQFERCYENEGQNTLEFSQTHIRVRLDLNNPDNHSFLKSTLPRTNQKFMDKNHNKVQEQVKV